MIMHKMMAYLKALVTVYGPTAKSVIRTAPLPACLVIGVLIKLIFHASFFLWALALFYLVTVVWNTPQSRKNEFRSYYRRYLEEYEYNEKR